MNSYDKLNDKTETILRQMAKVENTDCTDTLKEVKLL